MRLSSFLLALCLLAGLLLSASLYSRQSSAAGQISARPDHTVQDATGSGYEGGRMWRRAQIRVVPLEQVDVNRSELTSLRDRVARMQSDSSALWFVDPAVRKQLWQQQQLMRELLRFAEQQESNQGKSPTAMEVERHLNQIEGHTECDACHAGIVAQISNSRLGLHNGIPAGKIHETPPFQ